jgi:hypothetical protein
MDRDDARVTRPTIKSGPDFRSWAESCPAGRNGSRVQYIPWRRKLRFTRDRTRAAILLAGWPLRYWKGGEAKWVAKWRALNPPETAVSIPCMAARV